VRLVPLLLSIFAIALAVVPAATADKPHREVSPQGDANFDDQCAFPVLGHIDGNEANTIFFGKGGDAVKQIVVFPGNRLTFTNTDTGASITVQGTGSTQKRLNPDGTLAVKLTGHIFMPANPFTGEPGLWYFNGHASATVDADENILSVDGISGNDIVNLCDQLAP
jgi:hypothetical protein